jgi:hypothetical protein
MEDNSGVVRINGICRNFGNSYEFLRKFKRT